MKIKMAAAALGTIASVFSLLAAGWESDRAAGAGALYDAICPIVYPVDESPAPGGYQYIFYGNAFFVNDEGYLITAAHVLSSFGNRGQPYILVRRKEAPPRLVKAETIAVDLQHDVAVLRATPNPFAGNARVAFLPLETERPSLGQAILVAALRPSRVHPRTFEAALEDRSTAEVVDHEFKQLDNGRDDTELFLFSHEVIRGQSGAPVFAANGRDVVGFVEGQWLHPKTFLAAAAKQTTSATGAAVPIHYAIAVLQKEGIHWQAAAGPQAPADGDKDSAEAASLPAPLSLIAPPYPADALFGGEVLLDALVRTNGTLADIRVVSGHAPFLEKALGAVRTWTFHPARSNVNAIEARIGIAFQFAQPYVPPRTPRVHTHEAQPGDVERGALPVETVEPEYPARGTAEGSVILYDVIDSQGQISSTQIYRELSSLTSATTAAAGQWRFAPGRRAGATTDSAVVVVVTFRRPAVAERAKPSRQPQ
jgi:outer membrane biosynthesis protein TonB